MQYNGSENADAGLAAQVVRCRNNDQIDGFLFRSASEKYTAALLDGLYPRRKEYYMEWPSIFLQAVFCLYLQKKAKERTLCSKLKCFAL